MITKIKSSTLWQLSTYLLRYRSTLIAAGFALIFTSGVTLSMGYGVRLLIDDGFVGGSSDGLFNAAVLIIIITLFMSIGTYWRFYLVSWLGERVVADIRNRVFQHLLTLHPSYFEENRSGEIMSRLTTDTSLLQVVIGSSASMALRSLLTMTGAIVMLLVTNLKLSAFVIVCVPILLLPVLLFGRRVKALSRQSQDTIADVGSHAGEIIQQIKTVQSYTQEVNEQQRFEKHVSHAFSVAKSRIQQRALLVSVVILLLFAAISILVWVGGNDVLNGTMSAGDLGAFIFYAILVAGALATFSEVIGDVQRANGAAERLFELMAVKTDIKTTANAYKQATETSAKKEQPHRAQMSLNEVTFHYPSRPNIPAIEQLSLTIKEGQSLALVGPSGAGKSTIFDLLQRFYDPQSGNITLNGQDIKTLSPTYLRSKIAVVAQQPSLFSQDVMHNIRYAKPDASMDDVIAAAKAANAHEFIEKLPQGYHSFLGEQGVRLSGGQRQRIEIARAILKNPSILLLDEATSALDSESEFKVQLALENLMRNRTSIIVAHRLATIRNADQIAVMEQGRLVSIGAHNELLTASDLYRRLSELQFQTN